MRYAIALGTALIGCVVAVTSCAADDDASVAGPVVVGSQPAVPDRLVADIYVGALRRAGAEVETASDIGDRDAALDALDDGRVTLIPETTGALLRHLDPKARVTEPDDVFVALNKSLPQGLSVSDYSTAEITEVDDSAVAANVVPVFRKGALTEDQVRKLNVVAGELTTAHLTELTDRVRSGTPSVDVSLGWLDDRGL